MTASHFVLKFFENLAKQGALAHNDCKAVHS